MICVSSTASKYPIKLDRSLLFAAKRIIIIWRVFLFEEEIENCFVTMFVDFGVFLDRISITALSCWRVLEALNKETQIRELESFNSPF